MNVTTITNKDRLLHYTRKLGNINLIYDCGSRDALDGIELFQRIGAKELHVFECNPPSIEVCKNNLIEHLGAQKENRSWYLNNQAISDVNGELDFRPINVNKTITSHSDGNPGASSLFEANKNYKVEIYSQNLIKVSSITLNQYALNKSKPDLLWMDLQGAELMALKGADKILNSVKIILVEIGFREMYLGQCTFWEVDEYLKANHFMLANLDIGRWPKLLRLYKFLNTGPWVGNAIYVKNKNNE
jgi:FkbM family methyltransferase